MRTTLKVLALLLLSALPALSAPAGVTVSDLGALSNEYGYSTPAAINAAGQVTGQANYPGVFSHAFFWSASTKMIDLGNTAGGRSSSGAAINSLGHVCGSASTAGDNFVRAFFWKLGSPMVIIGTLPGLTDGSYSAMALNTADVVVGVYYQPDGGARAWRWTASGGIKELVGYGGSYTSALGINTAGTIVGTAQKPDGSIRAVSWTPTGAIKDLGDLGGGSASAIAINDAGQICGNSDPGIGTDHPFLWEKGKMKDLGSLIGPANSAFARGMNSKGHVVGTSSKMYPDSSHGFLWTQSTGMIDLGNLEPNAMSEAYAVNDNDRVVGYSIFNNGWRAFVWDPGLGMRNLGSFVYNSYAIGVNNAGTVLGYGENGSVLTRSFIATTPGQLQDLGGIGGGISYAYAMNDNGEVVGDSYSDSGYTHAFYWSAATKMIDIGTVGDRHSRAIAININGEVAANSGITQPYDERPFYWSKSTGKIEIPGLGGERWSVVGINRDGVVAGNSFTPAGEVHAFRWTRTGGIQDIGTAGDNAFAMAINDDGQICGYHTAPGTGILQAFLWKQGAGMRGVGDNVIGVDVNNHGDVASWSDSGAFIWKGTLRALGGLGDNGGGAAFVHDVNNLGTVVGQSYTPLGRSHAFAGRAMPLRDLGDLGDIRVYSEAFAVNDVDEVVGVSGTSDSDWETMRAFIVRGAGPMVDLGTLGGAYGYARTINALGQVAGQSELGDGQRHAARWSTR